MSPSARKNMSRVWLRMAGTSDATKYSPLPRPITTGGPSRAATILFGSGARGPPARTRRAACLTAARTACSRLPSKYFSTRCAITSVSVSVLKTWPSRCSCSFSGGSFPRCRCGPPRCRRCNRGADGRFLRWGGRAWPSACGRCRRSHPPGRSGDVFEVAQLAGSAAHAERYRRRSRPRSGRIVAAVFEPLQAVQNDGNGAPGCAV
jgi:hypothetical protein